jgi:branched-chain amino acid transport system permease protein
LAVTEAEAAISAASRASPRNWRLAGCLVGGALVVAAGPFILDTYSVNILIRGFLYALVALTVDILWGYTGILTFGQAAYFGIGAYATALIFTHVGFEPATILLAVGLALGIPALAGLVVGWLSFYPGSTPLYASVISLAFPIVVTQVIFSGGTFSGSSSGLVGYEVFDLSIEAWFWIVGAALLLAAGAAYAFVKSEMALLLVAIRDNETRCAYLGIDAPRVKILLTAALATVAGFAGFGYANFSGVVAPEIAGFVFGTELVIYVALGGRGTLLGPLIGTVVIDAGSSYLSGDLPYVWQLIVGLVFIVVIVALPNGLTPLLGRLWHAISGQHDRQRRAAPVLESQSMEAAPTTATLEIVGVSKSFGSLKVLEDITLSIVDGELVSLVGPNGAGKTTLMRCISDGRERSSGTVRVNGEDIGGLPPNRVVRLGLGRKFQTAGVFESLTVAECLRIAGTLRDKPSPRRPLHVLRLPEAARAVVETTGLVDSLLRQARLLSHGQKQALELAMVLALEPKIVLLDEPTAGLTNLERRQIGGILRELASRHRLAVILVEHDLDFVREISSRVVVLHQGRIVLDGAVEAVVGSKLIRDIYAGSGHG